MPSYYPEMGEEKPVRLFSSRHVYRSTYSVEWSPENNDAALAAFKRLRIRPQSLRFLRVGIELTPVAKADKWSALITSTAVDKLLGADLTAHEILLD